MTAADVLRDARGAVVDREGSILLGRGGEARVWGLPKSGEALKLLEPSARTADRIAGLEHLASRPRPRMLGARDEAPWGWPERLVYEGGACVGYTMRWFTRRKTLFSVVCPTERVRAFPAFDSRYVHRVGANLASAVACMQDAGVVIGDLSESNVLVASDATVALVDVDSYQFMDGEGRLHPCPVGKPEFLPPEHHGPYFAATPKSPESDAFALAVLLFQMLFDGPHPFSGVHLGPGTPPTIGEAILAGDYVFARGSALAPRLGMPGVSAVGAEVLEAFARTFVEGLHRPSLRTSAHAWAAILARAEADLVRCVQVPAHRHPRGARCAWCERRSTFGRAFETFTAAPPLASEAIALPATDGAPPTQRALPRVADDETPIPPTATAAERPIETAPSMRPPGAAPGDDGASAGEGPRARRRLPRRARPVTLRARASARRPEPREAPALPPPAAPSPARRDDAPPPRTPALEASRRPAARTVEEATRRAPALAAPATRATAARRLGLRHAIAAALLAAAFALGRGSAGGAPDATTGAARAEPLERGSAAPQAAVREGPRGSVLLRRDAPTAEKRTPRPPR